MALTYPIHLNEQQNLVLRWCIFVVEGVLLSFWEPPLHPRLLMQGGLIHKGQQYHGLSVIVASFPCNLCLRQKFLIVVTMSSKGDWFLRLIRFIPLKILWICRLITAMSCRLARNPIICWIVYTIIDCDCFIPSQGQIVYDQISHSWCIGVPVHIVNSEKMFINSIA